MAFVVDRNKKTLYEEEKKERIDLSFYDTKKNFTNTADDVFLSGFLSAPAARKKNTICLQTL